MTTTVIAARLPSETANRARTVAGPSGLSSWVRTLVVQALDAQNDNATGRNRGSVTQKVGTDVIPPEAVSDKPPDATKGKRPE